MTDTNGTMEHSRAVSLERVPKWLWSYTCRCRKWHGMVFDIEREMHVCEVCRLPHYFQVTNTKVNIASDCMGCGDVFVRWNKRLEANFCKKCGGDNAAERAQRTLDPHKTPIEGVD